MKPTSPKPSQEPSIEPSRESTRASKTKPSTTRLQAFADFHPDATHLDLAAKLGLDVDGELAKWRDWILAKGNYPADPAAAFRVWLRRGRELNLGKPQPAPADRETLEDGELDRRARKLLDSSTPLRRRIPDRSQRARWAPAVKAMLKRGASPVDIVNALLDGDPSAFEDLGIPVDDLDRIA